MTEQEMVTILEQIARESTNAAARIAAIKELRSIARAAEDLDAELEALVAK
jgi:hypothetical protein